MQGKTSRENESSSSFDHSKGGSGDNMSLFYLQKSDVTLYIREWIEVEGLALI